MVQDIKKWGPAEIHDEGPVKTFINLLNALAPSKWRVHSEEGAAYDLHRLFPPPFYTEPHAQC